MENKRRKTRPAIMNREPSRKRLPVSGIAAKKLMSISTLGVEQLSLQITVKHNSCIYNYL
jgi:hypothetical protein